MKISVILEMLTANFETDAKRAQKTADKAFAEIEKSAKRMGLAIGAGLVAGGTALAALTKRAIDTADQINKMAQSTGASVEKLSAFKFAIEQSGGSIEVLAKGMQKLAKDAAAGGDVLARAGVNARTAAGEFRPVEDVLLDVADKFSKMKDGAEKAAYAQELFGKSGVDLIPFLNQGRDGIKALTDQAERLGLVISGETAAAAEKFNDNLDALKSAALGLGNDIMTTLVPALVDLTDAAVEFVEQIRADGTLAKWGEAIKTTAGYVDELAVFITARLIAGALVSLIATLATASSSFALATAAANTFRLALALVGGPVGLLVTAIAGLAVVVYNYEDAADLSRTANDNLRASIDNLNKATGAAIQPSMDLAAKRKDEAIETLKAAGANLKLAEAQLAVAELSRDSDPTSNLEGMLSQDAQNRIKELGAEIERTLALVVEYDAALPGAAEKQKAFADAVKDASAPTITLGKSIADTAADQKAMADAAKLAEDAQKLFGDQMRKTAEEASAASAKLNDILDTQAAAMGGPGVSAALDYRDRLREIYDLEVAMLAIGPPTAEMTARLAQAREQAGELYHRTLDKEAAAEQERLKQSQVAADEYNRIWENAYEQQSYLFADALTGQIDSFDDFVDSLESIWLRALSDMLAAQLRSGIGEFQAGSAGGGSGGGFGGMIQGLLSSFMGGGGSAAAGSGNPGGLAGLGGNVGTWSGSAGSSGGMFGAGGTGMTAGGMMGAAGGALMGIQGIRTGNVGQGVLGGAMAGMQIGGPWGALVGAIIGGLGAAFNKPKPPDFRLGGDSARVRNPEGDFSTVFGNVNAGSRLISWEELIKPVQEFDLIIKDLVTAVGGGDDQLADIRDSLARWSVDLKGDAATVENVLNSRFGAILTTFSGDVQGFVGAAGTVQERVARLGDALAIENIVDEGKLGETFASVSALLVEYRDGTEDIGATYARVLGSVTLLDEALNLSGVAIAGTRDEIIRLATDITEAAGGLDRATALWGSFFANFYSPEELARNALSNQRVSTAGEFADIGLSADSFSGPGGARAFRDAFEAALPTLTGEQIVQWLEAGDSLVLLSNAIAALAEVAPEAADNLGDFMAGVAAQLAELAPELSIDDRIAIQRAANDELLARAIALSATEEQIAMVRELGARRLSGLLEEQNALLEEQAALVAQQAASAAELSAYLANLAAEAAGGITPYSSALQSLNEQYQDHVQRLNDLAVASGRAGASAAELAVATDWYRAAQVRLVAEMFSAAQSIIGRLNATGGTSGAAVSGGFSGVSTDLGGIDAVNAAVEDRYARELGYLQQIDDFINGLDLSALSPLTPEERLNEAQSQFQNLLAAAQGGDLDALEKLQGAAQAYLQEAQGFFGGVGAYEDIFGGVQDALRALVDRGPQNEPGLPVDNQGGSGSSGSITVEAGESFVQLSELERYTLSTELTGILRDLISATGMSLVEISDRLGLDLRTFVADLGVDLNSLTVVTGGQLADISRNLGVELTDLAGAVGVSLGTLGDEQSLLNDALEAAIATVPTEFRDQIQGYLTAIETATTEADANAAVAAAEAAINLLPAGIRDLLAPFFDGVDSPTDVLLQTTIDQAADIAWIRAYFENQPLQLPDDGAGKVAAAIAPAQEVVDSLALQMIALEAVTAANPAEITTLLSGFLLDIEEATDRANALGALAVATAAINDLPMSIADLLAPFSATPSLDLLVITTSMQAEDVAAIRALLEAEQPPEPGDGGPPPEAALTTMPDVSLSSSAEQAEAFREELAELRAEIARGNRNNERLMGEGNEIAKSIERKSGNGGSPQLSRAR